MKRFVGTAAALALMLPGAAVAQDTIKVGILVALEGAFAAGGADGVRNVELALKLAGGTAGGKKIETVVAPSDTTPATATRMARVDGTVELADCFFALEGRRSLLDRSPFDGSRRLLLGAAFEPDLEDRLGGTSRDSVCSGASISSRLSSDSVGHSSAMAAPAASCTSASMSASLYSRVASSSSGAALPLERRLALDFLVPVDARSASFFGGDFRGGGDEGFRGTAPVRGGGSFGLAGFDGLANSAFTSAAIFDNSIPRLSSSASNAASNNTLETSFL